MCLGMVSCSALAVGLLFILHTWRASCPLQDVSMLPTCPQSSQARAAARCKLIRQTVARRPSLGWHPVCLNYGTELLQYIEVAQSTASL